MTRHIEPLIQNKEHRSRNDSSYNFDITKYKSSESTVIHEKNTESHFTGYKTEEFTWENTLERCIKSIVSIKGYRARGLDTELPGVFTATGFIVDAERGIMLSNRHVVAASPISAQAVLCNYEEIDLVPIYRDPVHDFGFFKYDPSKIRFLDIPGIQLYPQGAKIGQDIRVVGNDAGEKLSILSGTLARLDREAPNYGIGDYNDFNTFYYQAASSTSSGSSGSPVLDLYGRAIALNAGGASTSSSSYYLPLDRALRVLKLIQENRPVSRGTLQATFEYMPYDSLLQLGLSRHLEKKLRAFYDGSSDNSANEGLLVVKSVLPDGPASCHLESGDILLTCNGQLLSNLFVDLEEILDKSIETKKPVHLTVSRSGELRDFTICVEDLHSITPSKYLEFGGGVLNDLSYQMARSYGLSLKEGGVYVGAAGFMLGNARVLRKSVIVGVNNKQVKTINDFVDAISGINQGGRVPIRYYSLLRPMKTKVMILHVDWRWHKFQMAIRNDKTGYWDYEVLPTSLDKDPQSRDDAPSIVSIDCNPPFVVDGSRNSHSYGAGVIVSLDPPLIVCDRDTVPIGISVISITFQNSLTISADLLFLHPFYNFAVLTFDPSPAINAGIKIEAAVLDEKEFKVGDTVNYVGLSGNSEIDFKTTTITSLVPIRTRETSPARWRATNVEVFKVSGGTLSSQGGLFAGCDGKVRAFWMSFSIDTETDQLSSILGGLSAHLVLPVLSSLKSNKETAVYGLDAEFWGLQLSNARLLGLNEKWVSIFRAEATGNKQPSVLYVLGIIDPSTESGKILKNSDLVLEINGKIPTSISDLSLFNVSGNLNMIVLRDGKELSLSIPTTRYNGKETTEVVGWQGMLVQESHSAAKEQVQKYVPEGVYVSSCLLGSPAQACLKSSVWITEISQIPVKSLKDFISVITNEQKKTIKNNSTQLRALNLKADVKNMTQDEGVDDNLDNNSHVQVKYVTADNVTHVKAIRLDKYYWPTWRVRRDDSNRHRWELTSFD
ncbi:serine protease [Rhizopus stolonifer]|uniref:Serine protease n=1 Tax=Rhizopus stolonifer TaxID=4846 RepID=A0A367KYG0_RHIST|nr:serine protease [Rhizopus stolonifer]